MRVIRQAATLTLALLALGGCWAQSALADDAEGLYDPGRVYVIELSLPEKSRNELAKDRHKYQPGTFSLAESTDGTPAGVGDLSDPVSVEVKLKGSASYRPLSEKSAFKIRFPGAPFRGLRYMTLNNMVEDPSMIHETLAYTAFRGAGVPASRTGYAYVYVDGDDYGIHLNIETLDQIALEKRFGPFHADTQHLYEGEGGADVHPGLQWNFEVDEGDDGDRGDLEELIDAVNSSGPLPWASRVASTVDLQEMTTMWAVEKYIGQWDGYAGKEHSELPNNYYLYSDAGGKFQMFPWGNDESWQAPYHLPFDGRAGLLFDRCLDDGACLALYRQSVAAVRKAIVGMDLDSLAVDSAALLAPWQAMEQTQSTREEHSLGKIGDGVAEARAFIASRPAEAAEWLGEELESKADPGGEATSTPAPLPFGVRVGSPSSALRVGRAWVAGGVLRARMRLWAPGVARLRATISTGEGARVLCRDRVAVKNPRSLILRCSLPASIGERLSQGPLDVTVATRFVPEGGVPENVTRRITLPRA